MVFRIKELLKSQTIVSGSFFSLFSFINQGFGFCLLLLLANYIRPAEYGYLSLFATIVMVINYFIALSTEGYLSVAYFRDGETGVHKVVSCIFATSFLIAFLLLLIVLVFGDTVSLLLSLPEHVLYLSIVISFFNLYANLNLDNLRIQGKVIQYGFYSCSNALLNFLLSVFLVKVEMLGWEGRIYAQTACCLLYGFCCLFLIGRKRYLRMPNLVYWKQMLLWGIPLIPHAASNFIRQGCDRYIINSYHSITDVGVFSFALTLSNIIVMVGIGFNQVNSINVYKVLGNSDVDNMTKLSILKQQKQLMFLVYTLAFIIITVLGYMLTPLVLPKYVQSVGYFVILAIYGYGYCLYFLYTNYLFYFHKTKKIMYTTFYASLLHLALSLMLTRYSLYFTAFVYGLTQCIVVLVIRNMAIKEIDKNLK